MRKPVPIAAGLVLAFLAAVPAASAVMVLGNSVGHGCYRSAEARNGSRSALDGCDEALKSGLLSHRDEVATYVNRGIVKIYGADHRGALADFDRAIEKDPSQAEAYLNKGSTIIRMGGDSAEAIRYFDEALARRTKRPEFAYFGRAVANEVAGNITKAYHDYRRAQQAAPKWSEPREELSRFQVRRASGSSM